MTNSRDILEAQACRTRRESLEKQSPSHQGRSNLLGVLAALSAVDKIAGRAAELALPTMRKAAQVSRWNWPEEQPERFMSPSDWYVPQEPQRSREQNEARERFPRVGRDPNRREGASDRDRATFAPFVDREPPKSKRPDSEGRMRGGAPDLWPRGDDVRSDPERDIAREASAEVLSIDDMATLMAARLRSRRFF